jgi:hypothetical protein
MSCKYQKHAKHQVGRIRHLEQELEAAREEISRLRAGNVNSSIREQRNLETWIKPKNSKSTCCRFSADDAPQVRLNNRFNVLETNTGCWSAKPMLQENLGTKFDVVSIFKPNAPLAKVVEDLGKLGKGLTKQDHIIVGGSGNSLDRNYYHSVEKDANFIAERAANTNVGPVKLFKRHDKPWMNGRVRRVNLRPDWA